MQEPWPASRGCLDRLHADAAEVGAEVIVACAQTAAVPNDVRSERYPGSVWLDQPNGSVFQLRALALAHARGEIVAITEDHARVEPGWCRAVLAAHAEYPEAAAVGGVVENGATGTLADCASFFIASGEFMPPVARGTSERISLQANVSYKRRALPESTGDLGIMTMTFHGDLARRGEVLLADDRIVVTHLQELSLAEHAAGHFHNGRSIAAFRLKGMQPLERALRIPGCAALPAVMLWRTTRTVLRKQQDPMRLVASLPAMLWLLLFHAAGELCGYVAGPGTSPDRVR